MLRLTEACYIILIYLLFNICRVQSMDIDLFPISTGSCSIPAHHLLSNNTRKLLKNHGDSLPNCSKKTIFLDSNSTHIWVLKEIVSLYYTIAQEFYCCYKNFSAATTADNITYSLCQEFVTSIQVKHDFVRVQCLYLNEIVYDDFFLFNTNNEKVVFERNSNSKSPNVLMLGFESMSRMNFLRTMKSTSKFLRTRGSIQLLAYNKLGDNSYPNLFPLFMGKSWNDVKQNCFKDGEKYFNIKKCTFIWNKFREIGFYTALAADTPAGLFGQYEKMLPKIPTDFYLQPFIYETRFLFEDRTYDYHACLQNRYFYKILLNFVDSVIHKVSNRKLFGIFWEQSVSHEHSTQSSTMDESYYNLLKYLEDIYYLNNTVLILFSDHGPRFGDFMGTRQGYIEARLPLLEVLLPANFRRRYSLAVKNFERNTRRLTTAFDVFETLRDLINIETPGITNEQIRMRTEGLKSMTDTKSISLFLPIPANRTCESLDISERYCVCENGHKIPVKPKARRFVAEALITQVNQLLSIFPQCAQLKLERIFHVSGEEINEHSRKFTVVITTQPGSGVLEGTLIRNFTDWRISGTIGRLNIYRHQSCIQDEIVKMYCFCNRSTLVKSSHRLYVPTLQ